MSRWVSKMDIRRKFTDKCYVLKSTDVDDGVGGFVKTWRTSSTIKCLITERSGTVRAFNSRNGNDSAYIMFCDANVDIQQLDRVQDVGNNIYEVTFVSNPNGLNNHLEIELTWKE